MNTSSKNNKIIDEYDLYRFYPWVKKYYKTYEDYKNSLLDAGYVIYRWEM